LIFHKNFHPSTVSESKSVSESELFVRIRIQPKHSDYFGFGSSQNIRIISDSGLAKTFGLFRIRIQPKHSDYFGFGSSQNIRIISDSDPQHWGSGIKLHSTSGSRNFFFYPEPATHTNDLSPQPTLQYTGYRTGVHRYFDLNDYMVPVLVTKDSWSTYQPLRPEHEYFFSH
jgi:hypothetical protein